MSSPISKLMRCFQWMLCLATIGLQAASASAASYTTDPPPGVDQLQIVCSPDPDGLQSTDVMTITVTTAGGKPSRADRHLMIALKIGGWNTPGYTYTVPITLSQGASKAQVKLVYTQLARDFYWAINVLESGRSILKNYSASAMTPVHNMNNAAQPVVSVWLEWDANASGSFEQKRNPANQYTGNTSLGTTGDEVPNPRSRLSVPELPEDWRVLLGFHGILAKYERLESATPGQLQSLNEYVLAGGCLIVQGEALDQLSGVDRLLSDPSVKQSEDQAADFRWGEFPNRITKNSKRAFPDHQRSHGAGEICFVDSKAKMDDVSARKFVGTSITEAARYSTLDDQWFWRNLVQTVGKTPVGAFIGFVNLFVGLIGPGFLYLTYRLKHRTLMLLLVPMAAGIVTLFVLIFNVLREGFDTHGRIVSLQTVDQHSRQGFVWSRQTYFSGSPPGVGLKFPAKTWLKPIDVNPTRSNWQEMASSIAEIHTASDAVLVRRWLAPRSQQQILVGHPVHDVDLPFQVQSAGGKVQLKNVAAHPLALAVLRTKGPTCYWARDVQPSEWTELAEVDCSVIERKLRSDGELKLPDLPDEVTVSERSSWSPWGGSWSTFNFDPLESFWKSGSMLGSMPESHYMIISRESDLVVTPFPAECFQKENNFHVLTGAYRW